MKTRKFIGGMMLTFAGLVGLITACVMIPITNYNVGFGIGFTVMFGMLYQGLKMA